MNKDDKILEMLENLTGKVDGLVTAVEGLTSTVEKHGVLIDGLTTTVKDLTAQVEDVRHTVAVIEVEHGQKIGALFDGYSRVSDDIKQILPVVELAEKTATDVSIIKTAVTSHAKIVNALKSAI